MSDDTTTWLKKNPVINPMRRSLKNSFRFHVPNSEMDSSIISNPDRGKDQQLFIPKMMERASMRVLKLKSHEFKVPEPIAKSSTKKTTHGSGSRLNNSGTKVKSKNISVPVKKSFLPVPKTQTQTAGKGPTNEPTLIGLKKPFVPCGSSRKSLARRSLLQKMVALSEVSRNVTNQLPKVVSETDSVPRSILKKKRNSLRRLSQSSGKEKSKGAKKVLFDVFESSQLEDKEDKEDKENESSADRKETEKGDNEFMALDEPTVFLNFRNPDNEEDDPQEGQQEHKQTQDDSQLTTASTSNSPTNTITTTTTNNHKNSLNNIVKMWKTYRESVKNLEVMRGSLENSLDNFLEHSLAFRDEYNSYKKNAQEIYGTLTKLAEDLDLALKRTLAGEESPSKSNRKSPGRRSLEKVGKIRLSDRSKAIKKNSGKKTLSSVKKGVMMEESFGSVEEKKGFY